MTDPKAEHLVCSFCAKPQGQVRRLIGGISGQICNDCVALCVQTLEEENEKVKKIETSNLPPIPAAGYTCAVHELRQGRQVTLSLPTTIASEEKESISEFVRGVLDEEK